MWPYDGLGKCTAFLSWGLSVQCLLLCTMIMSHVCSQLLLLADQRQSCKCAVQVGDVDVTRVHTACDGDLV